MTKLSKRAAACVALMRQGAYWRSQLETQYRGGEKFKYRLRTGTGAAVAGFGFRTWNELETAGLLASRACGKSSVWPSEWVAREVVA